MIMGTDSLIPKDYLSKIIERMNTDEKLVISSGVIDVNIQLNLEDPVE